LMSPQTGPCFIAAGLKIPMWIYRSKARYWDYVLNYDNHKVDRWFNRNDNEYKVFDEIYRKGGWDGVGSGNGSKIENNENYINFLDKVINFTPSIKTIVDIGCGDWNLMKELNIKKQYIGLDVSSFVIEENKSKYEKENIKFIQSNIVKNELPDGELCIIKDVFQHMPNEDILICLEKIKKYKICIIVNDYTDENNSDIEVGKWHQVNPLLAPFNVDGVCIGGEYGKQIIMVFNT